MCKMYGVVTDLQSINSKIRTITAGEDKFKNYIVRVGDKVPVITDIDPERIQTFTFGLTCSSSKKQTFIYNGDTSHVLINPPFRTLIRTQRCIVPATHFIATNSENNLAYCVHLINIKPFFFAGVWDTWKDELKDIIVSSFSIVTTRSNFIMSAFSIWETPVIIPPGKEKYWLKNEEPLSRITGLMKPFSDEKMDIYPINSDLLKRMEINDVSLLKQTGLSYWQGRRKLKEEEDLRKSAEIAMFKKQKTDREFKEMQEHYARVLKQK